MNLAYFTDTTELASMRAGMRSEVELYKVLKSQHANYIIPIKSILK